MNKYGYLTLWALLSMSLSGCMNPRGVPDYTASGALAGAATGAVIGSAADHSPAGALVGAAVGAVAGGAIGHDMDRQQDLQTQQYTRSQQAPPLSLEDIKRLAAANVNDDIIISQIHNSLAVYQLTSNDIIDLKNNGVSDRVIDYMVNTPNTVELYANTRKQAVQSDTTVYVSPYPGYVWIGGSWVWWDGDYPWHHGHHASHPRHWHHH